MTKGPVAQIIQIACCAIDIPREESMWASGGGLKGRLYALDINGDIWYIDSGTTQWFRVDRRVEREL